jgi:hypothetical protein
MKAGNLILMGDEIDMICSPGSAKNAESDYWRKYRRGPALDRIVNFGRHSHVAFIGVSRAPQDTWRRLRGQAGRMLVFNMDDDLEMDAVRSRMGKETDRLPSLGKYEYLDWQDGGATELRGGRL